MTWTDEDERVAREAVDTLGLQHAQLREHAYRAIRAAVEADRAATERRVLERVASLLNHETSGCDLFMAEGQYRRYALDGLRHSLAAAFPAWPSKPPGGEG